jgi:endonuclease YncB( thermonuclease family)
VSHFCGGIDQSQLQHFFRCGFQAKASLQSLFEERLSDEFSVIDRTDTRKRNSAVVYVLKWQIDLDHEEETDQAIGDERDVR